jgi:phosphohistidine swiveling domain-containing protein
MPFIGVQMLAEMPCDTSGVRFLRPLQDIKRLWMIHFEVMLPALVAPSLFLDLYTDLVEGTTQMDAYKIMQGIDNNSLRSGDDLWTLSRTAVGSDEVKSILNNTASADVMTALEASSEGKSFIDEINKYLQKWGNRSETVIELGDPNWVEDPSILIDNLKAYLKGSNENPRDKWTELVAERERLVSEAQELISGYPEPVKQQFGGMLAAGQAGQLINEDPNWWIDQQGNHQVRQVFLEFGNRLAEAGFILTRDDVFMLTGDEIIDSAKSGFSGDLKPVVTKQQADLDKWASTPPAPRLGMDYVPPPPNPMVNALGRFFGWDPVPESDVESGILVGTSGSAGKVTGNALVIIRLADAGRLNKGDILVTSTIATMDPALFATAGAIVADTGGALSHCAIVAREYEIPAAV